MNEYSIVILAAGKGTRMKSNRPKVLHEVAGKPMLAHIMDNIDPLPVEDKIIVIGHQNEQVGRVLNTSGYEFVEQDEQLGTGHALLQTREKVEGKSRNILVLPGDIPLLTTKVLRDFVYYHSSNKLTASILTTQLEDPSGYGRIIRDGNNRVKKIVEEEDASPAEREVREINTSIICFQNDSSLWEHLQNLQPDNEQSELYLTDVIEMYKRDGQLIGAYQTSDKDSVRGVNTRRDLAEANRIINRRKIDQIMKDGVTVINPGLTLIDQDVQIGKDTVVHPFTHIKGKSILEDNCVIGPNSYLIDSEIGEGSEILYSVVENSVVRRSCRVGPYSHLRPGADIGPNVSVGNYVEVKKSRLENGVKANHLTYIGDSHIGKEVNVGAGTITCNYDGKQKHRTYIGEGSFIGSNASLVAPINIGENSVVGAGSTLTKDVPDDSLAVARKRQVNIKNWRKRGESGKDG